MVEYHPAEESIRQDEENKTKVEGDGLESLKWAESAERDRQCPQDSHWRVALLLTKTEKRGNIN